jgi:hypothetical protein
MHSSDPRSRDNLDILIERALNDSVGDAEPPAHVWVRIQSELTQSRRRPAMRWSGPVLQAGLLAVVFFLLGGVSLWQEWSADQLVRTPTVAPTMNTPVQHDALVEFAVSPEARLDAAETRQLREYSSSQTRAAVAAELQRRAPGVYVPLDDIPPHPRLQASALVLGSSGIDGLAAPPSAKGIIW